jgi:dephospho-CoA kinase
MRVLLTGIAGTGKSTLVGELRRRGHAAFDADDDGYSEPAADGRWSWRLETVRVLLRQHRDDVLFFAGCSEEQGRLPFDRTVLLTVPAAVIVERLRSRATNPYGRSDVERAQVLADLRDVEPLLRATADLVIDATAPVEAIADAVLASVRTSA